ncbi:hypothetical protein CDD81_4034 [Ophiocordyceps australis]|uniref:Fe2OG dioxygenase domain-containing protein n=1 Tax=Ophiocordyceps australis TaxID=1399860 RepID=A0A2C5YBZ1_9HYPO|nr:hypothetical protein CDD81_4034 [Ophiocordyceps australis]
MGSVASETLPIATVDISGYLASDVEATARIVSQLGQAAQAHGILYITGHGISSQLTEQLFDRAAAFFASPKETKQSVDIRNSRAMRGYETIGDQRLYNGKIDCKEGFMFAREGPEDSTRFLEGPNQWPREDEVPRFKDIMLESYAEMQRVCLAVSRLLALSLGLEEKFFDGLVAAPGSTTLMRAHRYPPAKPESGLGRNALGAHTDFGGVTLLLQDSVGGLEFFDHASERWHTVPPVEDALIMNLGDLIERWTNARYKSARHRVTSPDGDVYRFSVVFFSMGELDTVVECLPGCVEAGERCRYEPVRIEDHLKQRFRASYDAGVYQG